MTIRAFVPLKKLPCAKSRLARALPPETRQRLVLEMAEHVVGVLKPMVDEVIILTSEPLSRFADLPQLVDTQNGLNANLMLGVWEVPHEPGDILIVIFPDLPLLTAADVNALIRASAAGIAIAPDHHGLGTNAIAIADARFFCFRFGPGSRRLHAMEAARQGYQAVIVEREGLAYDVDDASMLHLCGPALGALNVLQEQ